MPAPNRQPGDRAPTSRPTTATIGFAALTDHELSARDRVIYWSLANWAWGSRPECWPSNESIAELTGFSPRSVQLALKQLIHRGHVFRRMVKTDRGWHRVLTIAERSRPTLTVVEVDGSTIVKPGGGGAMDCARGGATGCAGVAQSIAPPLAQSVAPESCLNPEEREKKLPPPATSQGGGSPTAEDSQEEPGWLKVDNLTPAEITEWVTIATTANHPMRRIARKIIERVDRFRREGENREGENTSAPGSRDRSPEADVEGQNPGIQDLTGNTESSQDK